LPRGGAKQVPYFVIASLQPIAAQRRLDSRILDFCNVSAELYLQRGRRGRQVELLPRTSNPSHHCNSPSPFFFWNRRRWLVVLALDQLSTRRNPNSAKNSLGLTDVNLFRCKIDMGWEVIWCNL